MGVGNNESAIAIEETKPKHTISKANVHIQM